MRYTVVAQPSAVYISLIFIFINILSAVPIDRMWSVGWFMYRQRFADDICREVMIKANVYWAEYRSFFL